MSIDLSSPPFLWYISMRLFIKGRKSPELSLGAQGDVSRNLRGGGTGPVMVKSGVPKGI